MRVYVEAIVFAVFLSSMLTARVTHGECVKIPIHDFLSEHKDSIILKGTVSSATEINDPDGRLRFKYVVDVDRVWKGSVVKRIDLYVGWSGNDPQIRSAPFFATAIADSTKRRMGITGNAYAAVLCSDVYSESAITTAFGAGKEPSKEAASGMFPEAAPGRSRFWKANGKPDGRISDTCRTPPPSSSCLNGPR